MLSLNLLEIAAKASLNHIPQPSLRYTKKKKASKLTIDGMSLTIVPLKADLELKEH